MEAYNKIVSINLDELVSKNKINPKIINFLQSESKPVEPLREFSLPRIVDFVQIKQIEDNPIRLRSRPGRTQDPVNVLKVHKSPSVAFICTDNLIRTYSLQTGDVNRVVQLAVGPDASIFHWKQEKVFLVNKNKIEGINLKNLDVFFTLDETKGPMKLNICSGLLTVIFEEEVWLYNMEDFLLKTKLAIPAFHGEIFVTKSQKYLVLLSESVVTVYDIESSNSRVLPGIYENHVVLYDDLWIGVSTNVILCYDIESGDKLWELPYNGANPFRLGDVLGLNSGINYYRIDPKTGSTIGQWSMQDVVIDKYFVDGENFWLNTNSETDFYKLRFKTGTLVCTRNFRDCRKIEIVEETAFLGSEEETIVMNIETGRILKQYPKCTNPFALNPLNELFICNKENGIVQFGESGQVLRSFEVGTEVTPSSICFSEDGEMMFTNLGLAANAVQWCTRNCESVRTLPILHPSHLAFHKGILYCGLDHQIHRFNVLTGEEMPLLGKDVSIGPMHFWKDRLIVCGKEISVWNIESGVVIFTLHQYKATSAAIFRDKLYIGMISFIVVFNLETTSEERRIALPYRGVAPNAIALNSTRLIVSIQDKNEILLYDLTLLELPTEWIESFSNTKKLISTYEMSKNWRNSFDQSFLMSCVQYVPGTAVQSLLKNIPRNAFLQPNKYGECAPSIVYQTSRGFVIDNWETTDRTEEERKGDYVTENQIEVFVNLMFHGSTYYRRDAYMMYHFRSWFDQSIVHRILWNWALKMMYIDHQIVIDLFKQFGINFNSVNSDSKTLLVEGCSRGMYELTQSLMNIEDVDVSIDCGDGKTALHYALLLPEKINLASDFHFLNNFGKFKDKLRCAQLLINPTSLSKKSNMFKPDNEGKTAYDKVLLAYDYATEVVKKSRDEFADRRAIAWSKNLYGNADLLLEDSNRYEIVQSKRMQFALRKFFTKALWYIVFLCLLTIATFKSTSNSDTNTYYFVQNIRHMIETDGIFDSIETVDNVYTWFENALVPSISEDGCMSDYNLILGKIRLKTIQVKENSCTTKIGKNFKIPFCYTDELHISKDPYGTTGQWKYSTDDQESPFESHFSNKEYGGGGFIVDLNATDINATMETVLSLRTGKWIDLNTRVAVASWTLYNVNLNKYATVRVLFEFGLSGNIEATTQLHQLDASLYTTSEGHSLLVIELLCLLYVILEFIVKEVFEMIEQKKNGRLFFGYFAQYWNYYEWLIASLTICVVVFRVLVIVGLNNISFAHGTFQNIHGLTDLKHDEESFLSILLILCWLRFLKLLRIPPFTGPVTQAIMATLRARKFVVFIGVFVLVLLSFTIGFSVAFGTTSTFYNNMGDAFMSTVMMAWGDFSAYYDVEPTSTILTPILFIALLFFVGLILLNLVVAILSEVYSALQANNERAWELYITRLWIENINNADIISVFFDKLMAKFQTVETAQNTIQFQDSDLDGIAMEFRQTLVPPDAVTERLKEMQKQITQLATELHAMNNKPVN